jgi:hypothetical protein
MFLRIEAGVILNDLKIVYSYGEHRGSENGEQTRA